MVWKSCNNINSKQNQNTDDLELTSARALKYIQCQIPTV